MRTAANRAALQPLYGQIANILGRRYPVFGAVAMFILGSGICGGASSIGMLIAGRALQGVGAGGVNVLVEVVVCDLVPLRERGQYLALIFGLIALGTAGGPIFGGLIVNNTTWRWVFYLNLPLGSTALALLILFLDVHSNRDKVMNKLARIDWIGNVIFIAAVVAVLVPLSMAGSQYSWSSWHIIFPLVLGLGLGFPIFLLYEASRFCSEPTMPLHLFSNRTSLVAFLITFLHGIVTIWTVYFLPVYFQGVKSASPARSGVMLIPTFLIMLPFVAVSGKTLEKFGRYKPIHLIGCAIMTIGFGLFSTLDRHSSTAAWVIFQGIETAGVGLVVAALLPAVQAGLDESDTALSASTWSFIRSFGLVWGVAIPSAIFNERFDQLASRIDDPQVAAQLVGGKAYEHATKTFLDSLPSVALRDQTIGVFTNSVKQAWYVGIAFAGLAFLLVFFEKEIELRKGLETEFGLKEKRHAECGTVEGRPDPGAVAHSEDLEKDAEAISGG